MACVDRGSEGSSLPASGLRPQEGAVHSPNLHGGGDPACGAEPDALELRLRARSQQGAVWPTMEQASQLGNSRFPGSTPHPLPPRHPVLPESAWPGSSTPGSVLMGRACALRAGEYCECHLHRWPVHAGRHDGIAEM